MLPLPRPLTKSGSSPAAHSSTGKGDARRPGCLETIRLVDLDAIAPDGTPKALLTQHIEDSGESCRGLAGALD